MTGDELLRQLSERVRAGRPNDGCDRVARAPATRETVADAEQALGHPLPDLLRRIYTEVADGGIGPGPGILDVKSLVAENTFTWPDDPDPEEPPKPPRELLFLTDWGCANWSMIDCREAGGGMWAWEEGDRWATLTSGSVQMTKTTTGTSGTSGTTTAANDRGRAAIR